MAKSTTLSFRGGSVTPGQGIDEGDINPLVVNRKLQDGTPQQQTYDPLLANQHFDFGRVKFRKNGTVVGSYDPFDSDKDIDLPEDATVTLVSVDAADLNTVLADLLSNAKLPVLQNVGGQRTMTAAGPTRSFGPPPEGKLVTEPLPLADTTHED